MQHITKEVPPFNYTYGVFDKKARKKCASFNTIAEAMEFVCKKVGAKSFNNETSSYVYHEEYDWLLSMTTYRKVVPSNWIILDYFHNIIPKDTITAILRHTSRRDYYANQMRRMDEWSSKFRRFHRTKKSNKKIKTSCATVPLWADYSNEFSYHNFARGNVGPKTQKERRQTYGHIDEYGESIVRGARRPYHLPDSYDDRADSLCNSEKSWKHHSKRRKQWIPK